MATPDSAGGTTPVDFLQAAWATPEPHEIFRDEQLGVLIVPDMRPVVPLGHVLVVAREATTWEELSNADALWAAARVMRRRMIEEFQPTRGVGITIWGNQSGTPHIHVFPRKDKNDGALFFDDDRPRANDEQAQETQRRLLYPGVEGRRQTQESLAEELRRRIGGVILGKKAVEQR